MFLNVKNAYKNSKERSHTFKLRVSYDPAIQFKNYMAAIESLRENHSHAVCKSKKLFDMERFHDSLVG